MKTDFLTDLDLFELDSDELEFYNGGSELTDWSWRQIGAGAAYIVKAANAFASGFDPRVFTFGTI